MRDMMMGGGGARGPTGRPCLVAQRDFVQSGSNCPLSSPAASSNSRLQRTSAARPGPCRVASRPHTRPRSRSRPRPRPPVLHCPSSSHSPPLQFRLRPAATASCWSPHQLRGPCPRPAPVRKSHGPFEGRDERRGTGRERRRGRERGRERPRERRGGAPLKVLARGSFPREQLPRHWPECLPASVPVLTEFKLSSVCRRAPQLRQGALHKRTSHGGAPSLRPRQCQRGAGRGRGRGCSATGRHLRLPR